MLTVTSLSAHGRRLLRLVALCAVLLLIAVFGVALPYNQRTANAAPDASTFDPVAATSTVSGNTYQSLDDGYGTVLDFNDSTPTLGAGGTAMRTDAIELGEWDPKYSGSIQGFAWYQRWGNAELGASSAKADGDTFRSGDEDKAAAPIPMAGVRVYAQYSKTCGTHKGFVSQVYTAVTEARGFYKINIADEVTPKGVVGFGADTTISAGCEKWRIWAENPDASKYRQIYSPAYGAWFPKTNLADTTYATQDVSKIGTVGGDDGLYNTKIAFSDVIDNRAMHLTDDDGNILTSNTPSTEWYASDGGYVGGSVGWNYDYSQGVLTWGPQTLLAFDTTDDAPAPGLKVYGSYLSDYAVCMVESAGLEFIQGSHDYGSGFETFPDSALRSGSATWNNIWESRIQNWIKVQIKAARWADKNNAAVTDYPLTDLEAPYRVAAPRPECESTKPAPVELDANGDPYRLGTPFTGQKLWIAETKGAIVRNDGTYSIYFNGIYGDYHDYQSPTNKDELFHGIATSPTEGRFPNIFWDSKHVNGDWLFVSIEDVYGTAVATPMMTNWYGALRYLNAMSNTGTAGWVGIDWDNQGDSSKRIDFSMYPGNFLFDALPYNSTDNYAVASDRITTRTEGLPVINRDGENLNTNDYLIIWRDDNGNQVKTCGPMRADSAGKLAECPFIVPADLDRITTYTASLHVLSAGEVTEKALASDSFTAVPVYLKWMSKYDDYSSGYNIWPAGMGANSNADTPIHNTATTVDGQPIAMAQSNPQVIPGVTLDTQTGELTGRPTATGRWKVHVAFDRWFDEGGDAFRNATECQITSGCYSSRVEYDVYLVVTDNPLPDAHKGTYYEYDVKSLYNDDVFSYLNDQQISQQLAELGIPNPLIGFQGSGTPDCQSADPNLNCARETSGAKVLNEDGTWSFASNAETTGYWKLQKVNKVTLDQVLLDRGLRANGTVISGVPKDPSITVSGEYSANEVQGTRDTKDDQPNAAHDRTSDADGWGTAGPNVRIDYTVGLVDAAGEPVLDNAGKQITRTHSDYVPLSILGEGAVAKVMGGTKILNEEPVPGITAPYQVISGDRWLVPSRFSGSCTTPGKPQWLSDPHMPYYEGRSVTLPQLCSGVSTEGYFVEVTTGNATAVMQSDGSIVVTSLYAKNNDPITLNVYAPGSAIPQSDDQFQFTLTPGAEGRTSVSVNPDKVAYDDPSVGFDYEAYFSQDETDLDQQGYNSPGEPQAVATWSNGTGSMTVTTSLEALMATQTTADDATRAFFKFPDLTFKRAGVYFFTIKEENLGEELITYNEAIHEVAVVVTGDDETGYKFVRVLDIATWDKLMAADKIGARNGGCVNGSGSPELSSLNDDYGFHLNQPTKLNVAELKNRRDAYWISSEDTQKITNWDEQFDTAFTGAMNKCLSSRENNADKYPAMDLVHMNFKDATQAQTEVGGTKLLFNREAKGQEATAEKLTQELNQFTFTLTEGAEGYTSFAVKSASTGYAFKGQDTEFEAGFDATKYFGKTEDQLAADGFNGAGQPKAEANGDSMTVKTYLAEGDDTTGLFHFPTMNFNRAGVYYFTIEETKCPGVQISGIYSCDETKYPVAVVVTGADYVGYGYKVASVLEPQTLADATTAGTTNTCSARTTDTRDLEVTELSIADPPAELSLRLQATMAKVNPDISLNSGANFDVAFTEAVNACMAPTTNPDGTQTYPLTQINLTVNNYRSDIKVPGLPFTGGWHYHWFFLGGSMALALAAAYLAINRKRFFTVAVANGKHVGKHRK